MTRSMQHSSPHFGPTDGGYARPFLAANGCIRRGRWRNRAPAALLITLALTALAAESQAAITGITIVENSSSLVSISDPLRPGESRVQGSAPHRQYGVGQCRIVRLAVRLDLGPPHESGQRNRRTAVACPGLRLASRR